MAQLRTDIERRIERKREEIAALEGSLREARSYIQALEDTLKVLPRDGANEGRAGDILRPNSRMAQAREAILKADKPLHVREILRAIGVESTNKSRAAMGGAIGAYVRKGEIFTRPAPNTYGLVEMEGANRGGVRSMKDADDGEPPEYFGMSGRPNDSTHKASRE